LSRNKARPPQRNHAFATVITAALDNGHGAAVTDGEALAGDAAGEKATAGGATRGYITDDVVSRYEAVVKARASATIRYGKCCKYPATLDA
jgi:hypothetical protein